MTSVHRTPACVLLSCLLLTGCGLATSERLVVPVMQPAEINLASRGLDRIAIGEIEGRAGRDVTEELTQALIETNAFTVVDRAHLERVMEEHELTSAPGNEGIFDEETRLKLGEFIGAAALVFGRVSTYDYTEDTSVDDRKNIFTGDEYRRHTRTGTATVEVHLQVVDLTTGEVLTSRKITRQRYQEEHANDEWPPRIDRAPVLAAAREAVVQEFVQTVAPHRQYVEVTLFKDSDIPALEQGINFARIGEWEDAIAHFERAARRHPTSPKTHYNLGVACAYTHRFDRAEEALKRAYSLDASDRYASQIRALRQMRRDAEKLDAQQ